MIYTDVTASRKIRQEKLHRLYGFECTCPYCDLADDEAIARSDLARAELRDWRHTHPGFLKWSTDLCREDDTVIKSHQLALDIIEQEGMHGLQCTYFDGIALSYAMLGDEEQFSVWGKKVLAISAIQDPDRAAEYTRWLSDPRSMKKWGWRMKQRLREFLQYPKLSRLISLCRGSWASQSASSGSITMTITSQLVLDFGMYSIHADNGYDFVFLIRYCEICQIRLLSIHTNYFTDVYTNCKSGLVMRLPFSPA